MKRLVAAAVLAAALMGGCGGVDKEEETAAIAAAREAYEEARAAGIDFAHGPCIADPIEAMPEWVVDIAHDPRTDVDDDPANQCASYRSGDSDHFVELDPEGNLIRAK